jgi:site-specific recombinase XerD
MSSKIRDQFIDHMTFNGLAENTKRSYVNAVGQLSRYYNYSPDLLTKDQVELYFRHLIMDKKVSIVACGSYLTGIKYFYKNVCNWEDVDRFGVPQNRRKRILPVALSIEEIKRLFDATDNLKHRVLLKTAYSAGLRVSEVISLKPEHIESDPSRMLIRVDQGKGRKDRYTLLSKELLSELRQYWRKYRPQKWLFPGNKKGEHLTYAGARKVFVNSKKKPA